MDKQAELRISAEILLQLSALDSLDLAFVFFDEAGEAQFVSAKAGLLLDIRERHELANYHEILLPLAELGRRASDQKPLHFGAGDGSHTALEELELTSNSGRRFLAVSYARELQPAPVAAGFSQVRGTAVIFHDISYFAPFFKTIEQSRRNRALIVLASCVLGRALALDPLEQGLISAYQDAEKDFFRFQPASPDNLMQTDLLAGISTAVDIVDPLIVSSAKIVVSARTPLLLDISWPNFLRIISHLLLEATDFVGPFGRVHIGATSLAEGKCPKVQKGERTSRSNHDNDQFVDIWVEGQRKTEIPADAAPLELYIYRRYMPVHYRVLVSDSESSTQESREAEGGQEPRPLMLGAGGISFNTNRSLSRNTLSENLLIVSHVCRICGIPLQMTRPTPEVLRLGARVRLTKE